jgi:hypothetical protein
MIDGQTIVTARIDDVGYWHKADIPTAPANVRYRGKSGHRN